MEIVEISATIKAEINGKIVMFDICPGREGDIYKNNLLLPNDFPKTEFCEVKGLRRDNEKKSEVGSIKEVLKVAKGILPVLSSLSLSRPIIWRCSMRHAIAYIKIFSSQNGYEIKILRGCLREDNPYNDPVILGEKDDQILMLSKKKI